MPLAQRSGRSFHGANMVTNISVRASSSFPTRCYISFVSLQVPLSHQQLSRLFVLLYTNKELYSFFFHEFKCADC